MLYNNELEKEVIIMQIEIDTKEEIVMKLLHYFITEKNYNPVILRGAKNEIWLENLDEKYEIIRIVSNYIHNEDQLSFDMFKTKRIVKDIKKKTLNYKLNVLSIFTDLGDSVKLTSQEDIDCINIKNEEDLKKYNFIYETFPDINEKLKHDEKGMELFAKITTDINKKSKEEVDKMNKIFKSNTPVLTIMLITINVLIFLYGLFFDKNSMLINNFALYAPYVRGGDYYRLISSAFLHVSLFHLLVNMYSLYIIGSQIENFFGKTKYIVIYLFSAIMGSLFSMLFTRGVSIGASGAIFGLLGAMLYFGYFYRIYLGNTITSQILPVILINLLIGFSSSSIDNFAHIGGLVGGIIITMALGVKDKADKNSRLKGIIFTTVIFLFLLYMNFIYVK